MALGHVHLDARRLRALLWLLVGIELLLVVAYLVPVFRSPTYTSLAIFDLDSENSIPTWFSATKLFAVSIGLLALTDLARRSGNPHAWFVLLASAAFCFLSVDEAASLHEKITRQTSHLDWMPRFNDAYGAWIFVYVPLIVGGIAVCFRPITSWAKRHRGAAAWFSAGGLVFVGGAVGLEIVGYVTQVGLWSKPLHRLQIAAEEFLEMLGASFMLYAVLSAYVQARDEGNLAGARGPQPVPAVAPLR